MDSPDDPVITPEAEAKPVSPPNAAVVIVFRSWLTLPVGLLMLLLGLAIGYTAREPGLPLGAQAAPASAGAPPQAAAALQPAAAPAASPQLPPTVEPTRDPEQVAQVMQAVTDRVRHFKGSASAPVTLLEFSDFQ